MKTAYYHQDTVYQMANIDLGQCQKTKNRYAEKDITTLQRGSKQSTQDFWCVMGLGLQTHNL